MNIHVPLRSILVATNLSDIGWLFPFACSVAEESGASITLLYVLTVIRGLSTDQGGMPYYAPSDIITSAELDLKAYCDRARALNIQCEAVVVEGRPNDTILATAKQVQADLLIMGTRGHRGIEKWLLGSVAEAVLRSSPIPVITVGPNARKAAASGRPIKSILFATSLKGKSNAAARLTYRWSERLRARLLLLHVAHAKDKHAGDQNFQTREDELRALLPANVSPEVEVKVQIQTGRTAPEILATAAHFDLIALGAVGNPILERLAPEGTLYQVLAEARCPVATFHSEHINRKSV